VSLPAPPRTVSSPASPLTLSLPLAGLFRVLDSSLPVMLSCCGDPLAFSIHRQVVSSGPAGYVDDHAPRVVRVVDRVASGLAIGAQSPNDPPFGANLLVPLGESWHRLARVSILVN
jgi:hypothetical protein